jgi:alkylation response protein AidB-like acyl-CoA dehydrogenase
MNEARNGDDWNSALDGVVERVIAEQAPRVDKEGTFPEASMKALADAGLWGLLSAKEVGGLGQGPSAAAHAIERVAQACGSTAMVLCMHYAGAVVLERYASEAVRRDAATGKHLSTLAFSEVGSRSQFWAPVSTATRAGDGVRLDAKKSWITSAGHATAYVWSSQAIGVPGASTVWLVPRDTAALRVDGGFDGLGLRGNDSRPVTAEGARVPASAMLGADGEGPKVMLEVVLPYFNVMNAACSVGLMEAATQRTIQHITGTRFEHAGQRVVDLPTVRAYVARMRIRTDATRALLQDTCAALEGGRADAMLRVLECKAAGGEAATEVTELAMRVCGGAAFRRDVGVERYFRDARAASVMGPTTDALYDFIGRAVSGMPLFG